MNQQPPSPDWIRLKAALDEAMAAIDCEIDPALDIDIRTRFHKFRLKLYNLVKDASKIQKAIRQQSEH